MRNAMLGAALGLALIGCGKDEGKKDEAKPTPAPPVKERAEAEAAAIVAPPPASDDLVAENTAWCEQHFALDAVKGIMGVDQLAFQPAHPRALRPGVRECQYIWPTDKPPEVLALAKVNCTPMQPKRDQLVSAFKGKPQFEDTPEGLRVELPGTTQFHAWTESPTCYVVGAVGFTEDDKSKELAQHLAKQITPESAPK